MVLLVLTNNPSVSVGMQCLMNVHGFASFNTKGYFGNLESPSELEEIKVKIN